MKIGARLGAGFAIVLTLLTVLIVVGWMRLGRIGEINDSIIEREWVIADAAQIINARIRANARFTMQLFITNDKTKITDIYREIEGNKAAIDAALRTLEKLAFTPEGKILLVNVNESRALYVASFSKVAQLLASEKPNEAAAVMNNETLPALDRLQKYVSDMVRL